MGKAACNRRLCNTEAAWKPQDGASKARSLMGNRVHTAQQDSHTYNYPLTYTHTTHSCNDSHISTQTHACKESVLWQLPRMCIFEYATRKSSWENKERQRPCIQKVTERRKQSRISILHAHSQRKTRLRTWVMLGYKQPADKNNGNFNLTLYVRLYKWN